MAKKAEPVYINLPLTKTQTEALLEALREGASARYYYGQIQRVMGHYDEKKARAAAKRSEEIYQLVERADLDAFWAAKQAAEQTEA